MIVSAPYLLQFEALLLQLFPVRIQSRIEEVAALPAPGDCGAPAVAPADADSAAKTQLAPFNLVLVRHGPILIVRRSTGGRHPLSGGDSQHRGAGLNAAAAGCCTPSLCHAGTSSKC